MTTDDRTPNVAKLEHWISVAPKHVGPFRNSRTITQPDRVDIYSLRGVGKVLEFNFIFIFLRRSVVAPSQTAPFPAGPTRYPNTAAVHAQHCPLLRLRNINDITAIGSNTAASTTLLNY